MKKEITPYEVLRILLEVNIEWQEIAGESGFFAEWNGVKLHLYGGGTVPIYLEFSHGVDRELICEPSIPRSQVPAARLARSIRRMCGKAKPESTLSEKEELSEDIRKYLKIILANAYRQVELRSSTPEARRKHRERILQRLFVRIMYGVGSRS